MLLTEVQQLQQLLSEKLSWLIYVYLYLCVIHNIYFNIFYFLISLFLVKLLSFVNAFVWNNSCTYNFPFIYVSCQKLFESKKHGQDKIQMQHFIIKKMLQKFNNDHQLASSSFDTSRSDLHLSIANINQIMERINQAVKRSQGYLNDDLVYLNHNSQTFVTQENLITENLELQDNETIRNIKARTNGMKIPLHQLHKKNKLSTVVEESQSQQSGRTYQQGITPRDPDQQSTQIKYDNPSLPNCSFTKQILMISQCQTSPAKLEDETRKSKKIMGIRKASCFSGGQYQKKQYENQKLKLTGNHGNQQPRQKQSDKKFLKTKSMANIKCDIFERKIEYQFSEELLKSSKQRERSKSRKGLSLLSKHSLKSEQNDTVFRNIENNSSIKSSKACTQLSSQKKQRSAKITIKRKTINPFILSKQLGQAEKKPECKIKNCLSRTNIRDFYVSKRINK